MKETAISRQLRVETEYCPISNNRSVVIATLVLSIGNTSNRTHHEPGLRVLNAGDHSDIHGSQGAESTDTVNFCRSGIKSYQCVSFFIL